LIVFGKPQGQERYMDPFTKDVVEVAAWVVALVGGLVASFKALHETALNRKVRVQELRWKKAELARETLTACNANREFHDAVTMLDWSGREFEVSPGRREEIVWEELPAALQAWQEPVAFTEKEVYIRDCFDQLFDGMDTLEHYLRTDLLDFADVQFPMAYHVEKLREHWSAVSVFINHYDHRLALAFVNRFPVGEKAPGDIPLQPTASAAGSRT
jgi:hypothetical protein